MIFGPRELRAEIIAVRVTTTEKQIIERTAKSLHMTASEFVRQAIGVAIDEKTA